MLKLNAGVSRKVGEANYGSRGATVNVELELESGAINDAQDLQERIRNLFALANQAVTAELANGGSNGPAAPSTSNGHDAPPTNGSSRPATESQQRAIRAICGTQGLNADDEARRCFSRSVCDLSLREASNLIDELKNGQAARR